MTSGEARPLLGASACRRHRGLSRTLQLSLVVAQLQGDAIQLNVVANRFLRRGHHAADVTDVMDLDVDLISRAIADRSELLILVDRNAGRLDVDVLYALALDRLEQCGHLDVGRVERVPR